MIIKTDKDMTENNNRKKHGSLSLATKANILIVVITLGISLSLIAISDRAYRNAAIQPYYERLDTIDINTDGLTLYMDHFLPFLGTDELRKVKETTLAHNSRLIEWMSGKPSLNSQNPTIPKTENMFTDWYQLNMNLYRFMEFAGFDDICTEIVKNNKVYRITVCDAVEETYSSDSDFGLEESFLPLPAEDFESPKMIQVKDAYMLVCCRRFKLNNGEGRIWMTIDLSEQLLTHGEFLRNSIIYVLVLTTAISLISMSLMHRYIITPIRKITKAAQVFVADENGQYSRDKISQVEVNSRDELQYLNEEMRSMQTRIVDNTEHLTQLTIEKERLNGELNMANQIQTGFLPRITSQFKDRREFRMYASMKPAKEVGGDFYDFFFIDDDHLVLSIADVSGKGIPAALFMMITKAILKNNAHIGKTPAEILELTNDAIYANNRMEMFVTIWLGILEISSGKLIAANAGHEYPAVYDKADGKFDLYNDPHGFIIGGMDEVQYKNYELMLNPGDKLFVYTDGVMEAKNDQGEQYGKVRVTDTLNSVNDQGPEEIIGAVYDSLYNFMGESEQFDDITMLCLEYLGDC
ncbi:MAG: SpoIIE family protein phosphatase [Erysipelotrichaceae bacterium]|nr:SpoIIE family protein phosphatase [Erysipelotrichaceae bacterium]